eukprot:3935784-Rhodomonas_salina.2
MPFWAWGGSTCYVSTGQRRRAIRYVSTRHTLGQYRTKQYGHTRCQYQIPGSAGVVGPYAILVQYRA